MAFADWIRGLFSKADKEKAFKTDMDGYFEEYESAKFRVTELALFTAINLIARSLAKCEFVTVNSGKEVCKGEYYLWNYSPNRHQTKIEFISNAVANLIFDNELLIFESSNGQLLIAESFSHNEYAMLDDTFSGITCRNMTLQRSLKESEVIYLKYNNFALRGILGEMCAGYENLMKSAEERYNKAVGHKGVFKTDSMMQGDLEFEKTFNEIIKQRFNKYFNSKNAVLPLFEGQSYTEPSTDAGKTTNTEINDIQKLRTEAYSAVGNALHIPPAIISGTASQLSDAMDAFIGEAVDPLAQMFEQEITKKRYGEAEFIKGNYLLIDTTYVKHIDAISSANNIDKAIASGIISPEKAQKYCNMLPSNEEWAKKHYMTKNYQTADMTLKGGEF